MTREEKEEMMKEKREERPKFGRPKEKGGGTTNAEKTKNQPFVVSAVAYFTAIHASKRICPVSNRHCETVCEHSTRGASGD